MYQVPVGHDPSRGEQMLPAMHVLTAMWALTSTGCSPAAAWLRAETVALQKPASCTFLEGPAHTLTRGVSMCHKYLAQMWVISMCHRRTQNQCKSMKLSASADLCRLKVSDASLESRN